MPRRCPTTESLTCAFSRNAGSVIRQHILVGMATLSVGLLGVAAGMPTLQQLLYRSMGRELSRGRRHMLVLGSMSSGERVAAFLLDMSQRSLARGYSKNEFVLRMSRAEIGSYLGVSLETVSRVLSGFKRERYLDVDNRVIRINDLEGFTRAFESQVP